jgi:hypothetical protein
MSGLDNKLHISKLRISYIVAFITIFIGVCSYGYHLYALAQDLKINQPQPQIERLIKDLRIFHVQTRRFPANFGEVNQQIWRTKPTPDYGHDGRQARSKNYYYYYTKVKDETCAFWALPLGPQRHYASSFFIVLSPGWVRAWKGKAMSDEEIAQVPAIPSPAVLAEFKMQEMPRALSLSTINQTTVHPFQNQPAHLWKLFVGAVEQINAAVFGLAELLI